VSATAGDSSAVVAFTPPVNTGGLPITIYTVTASPGGQAASGTGSPIMLFGLSNGESYTFTVTATNTIGTGPASAPSAPVVPYGAERPHPEPPAPSPRPDVPVFTTPTGPRMPPPPH
jgi:hypothetical protein